MKRKFFTVILCFMLLLTGGICLTACGPTEKEYIVSVQTCEHGIVSVNKSTAKEGEEIIITAVPENGYELAAITCDGVMLDSFTLSMPAHNISISALFNVSTGEVTTELINYKKGSYVCRSAFSSDGDYQPEEMYYSSINIKENNKCDIYAYFDGMKKIDDVLYTRQGNNISANIYGQKFDIRILEENTLLIKDTYYSYIYCWQEDKTVATGNFYSEIDDDGTVYLSISQTEISIEVERNGQIQTRFTGNYNIFGNRLYIESDEGVYCAKIRSEYNFYDVAFINSKDLYIVVEDLSLYSMYDLQFGAYRYALSYIDETNLLRDCDSYDTLTIYDDNTLDFFGYVNNVGFSGYVMAKKVPFSRIKNDLYFTYLGKTFALNLTFFGEINIQHSNGYARLEKISYSLEVPLDGEYFSKISQGNEAYATLTIKEGIAKLVVNEMTFEGEYSLIGDVFSIAGQNGTLVGKFYNSSSEKYPFGFNKCGYFTATFSEYQELPNLSFEKSYTLIPGIYQIFEPSKASYPFETIVIKEDGTLDYIYETINLPGKGCLYSSAKDIPYTAEFNKLKFLPPWGNPELEYWLEIKEKNLIAHNGLDGQFGWVTQSVFYLADNYDFEWADTVLCYLTDDPSVNAIVNINFVHNNSGIQIEKRENNDIVPDIFLMGGGNSAGAYYKIGNTVICGSFIGQVYSHPYEGSETIVQVVLSGQRYLNDEFINVTYTWNFSKSI